MDWEIVLGVAWPHERFKLGWEIIEANEQDDYLTVIVDLLFFNVTLHYGNIGGY